MKIIYAKETDPAKKLTFGMVVDDQFFVCGGKLWQKVDYDEANMIAEADGSLYAVNDIFAEGDEIDRILPRIEKIEF